MTKDEYEIVDNYVSNLETQAFAKSDWDDVYTAYENLVSQFETDESDESDSEE